MAEFIKISLYSDDIWQLKEYQPTLLEALVRKDCLIEIVNGLPPFMVVFGVPHQAAIGVDYIAELRPDSAGGKRASDENAAAYALVTFSKLRDYGIPCKLIIYAHSTDHDPNKNLDSPYCKELFSEEAHLLFECHAAGGGKNRVFDLELSAGSNRLGKSLEFGRLLAGALNYEYTLAAQVEAGSGKAKRIGKDIEEDVDLKLPGLETTSLIYAGKLGIPALHLEAKPRFRIPENKSDSVTRDGFVLGKAIANVLIHHLSTKRDSGIA